MKLLVPFLVLVAVSCEDPAPVAANDPTAFLVAEVAELKREKEGLAKENEELRKALEFSEGVREKIAKRAAKAEHLLDSSPRADP